MSFKYLEWEIVPEVKIPMMEDSSGELWGTNRTVAALLGMSEEGVRKIYFSNKREFQALSVSNSNAKEFLLQHKQTFSIKRLRGDMPLWSSDDVLTFCYRATGDKAIDIRWKFSKLIKEHSKRNYVQMSQYQELEAKFNS